MRPEPCKAQIYPWTVPTHLCSRCKSTTKVQLIGKMYIVLIDVYSKLREIVSETSTFSDATVKALGEIFSCHAFQR